MAYKQKAQGLVEYALLLALVAVVAGSIYSSGDIAAHLHDVFNKTINQLGK